MLAEAGEKPGGGSCFTHLCQPSPASSQQGPGMPAPGGPAEETEGPSGFRKPKCVGPLPELGGWPFSERHEKDQGKLQGQQLLVLAGSPT